MGQPEAVKAGVGADAEAESESESNSEENRAGARAGTRAGMGSDPASNPETEENRARARARVDSESDSESESESASDPDPFESAPPRKRFDLEPHGVLTFHGTALRALVAGGPLGLLGLAVFCVILLFESPGRTRELMYFCGMMGAFGFAFGSCQWWGDVLHRQGRASLSLLLHGALALALFGGLAWLGWMLDGEAFGRIDRWLSSRLLVPVVAAHLALQAPRFGLTWPERLFTAGCFGLTTAIGLVWASGRSPRPQLIDLLLFLGAACIPLVGVTGRWLGRTLFGPPPLPGARVHPPSRWLSRGILLAGSLLVLTARLTWFATSRPTDAQLHSLTLVLGGMAVALLVLAARQHRAGEPS